MTANPFFSGRIPQVLYDAIEQHRRKSGESKTDVLVRALSTYVDAPVETSTIGKAGDSRMQSLEDRMKRVEQILDLLQTQQPSIEATAQDLQGQMSLYDIESADNDVDNETNNSLVEVDNTVISVDNGIQPQSEPQITEQTDAGNSLVPSITTKEVAKTLSWNYDKVQSRHKRGQVFNEKGYKFTPIREKGKPVWVIEKLADEETDT